MAEKIRLTKTGITAPMYCELAAVDYWVNERGWVIDPSDQTPPPPGSQPVTHDELDAFGLTDLADVTTAGAAVGGVPTATRLTGGAPDQWQVLREAPPTPLLHGAKGDGTTDDTAALQAWLAAGYTEGYVPPGVYRVASGLVQPASMSVHLADQATIRATAAMEYLWSTPLASFVQTKFLRGGGTLDCNQLANTGVFLPWFDQFTLDEIRVMSSAGHAVIIGDPSTATNANSLMVNALRVWRPAGQTAPVGSYGLWMRRVVDAQVTGGFIVGGQAAGIRADQGSNRVTNVHVWGQNGQLPVIGVDDNADNNRWLGVMSDTASQYSFRIRQFKTQLIACHSYNNGAFGPDNTATGIYFDKTAPDAVVFGHFFEGGAADRRLAKDFDAPDTSWRYYATVIGCRWTNVATQNVSQAFNIPAGGVVARGAGSTGFIASGDSGTLLNARQSDGTQVLNVNTTTSGSPIITTPNGSAVIGYSGNFTTPTWSVESKTGAIRPGSTAGRGASIFSGTGAPTIAGTAGDRYLRTDTPTVANQREYVCTVTGAAGAATWVGLI